MQLYRIYQFFCYHIFCVAAESLACVFSTLYRYLPHSLTVALFLRCSCTEDLRPVTGWRAWPVRVSTRCECVLSDYARTGLPTWRGRTARGSPSPCLSNPRRLPPLPRASAPHGTPNTGNSQTSSGPWSYCWALRSAPSWSPFSHRKSSPTRAEAVRWNLLAILRVKGARGERRDWPA